MNFFLLLDFYSLRGPPDPSDSNTRPTRCTATHRRHDSSAALLTLRCSSAAATRIEGRSLPMASHYLGRIDQKGVGSAICMPDPSSVLREPRALLRWPCAFGHGAWLHLATHCSSFTQVSRLCSISASKLLVLQHASRPASGRRGLVPGEIAVGASVDM